MLCVKRMKDLCLQGLKFCHEDTGMRIYMVSHVRYIYVNHMKYIELC